MRKNIAILTFVATAFNAISQTFAAPDPNFHIYLAFGQSNMEGNGPIESQDRTGDKRFQVLSAYSGCNNRQVGQWYDAVPPLANCNGKLGPVDYFGRTLIKKLPEQIKVGVSVVAVAGADIQLFEKDNYKSYNPPDWMRNIIKQYNGNPYGRLIEMGKKAQEVGVIKGILLHQGETNSGQQNWPNRVKGIYENILKDLGLNSKDVPLLAGEVVSSSAGGSCGGMNSIIQKLPQVIPTAHVISSQGLKHQGDGLHFTSADYRTFGQRYAEEMLKILGDVKVENGSSNNQSGNQNNNQTGNQGNNQIGNQGNNQAQGQSGSCWSTQLGYPCCKGKAYVLYTDSNGQWGVENDDWCGIPNTNKSDCWAKSSGFSCCSTSSCRTAQYFDYDGQWDYENGNWCGITTANTLC